MKEFVITENEENQRLDRYLGKYLEKAGKGFIGKIIRKKYVKVNGKRPQPGYMLQKGDKLELYLAQETIDKFARDKGPQHRKMVQGKADGEKLPIAYEDENLLVWNKGPGILTHGAPDGVVERAIGYLIQRGAYEPEKERVFVPSSSNRLDKNTSGLVFIAKNNAQRMKLNEKWKNSEVDKYYLTLVKGDLEKELHLTGYLTKDEKSNVSTVQKDKKDGAKKVVTVLEPLKRNGEYTLVQVFLITGRSHQIRAHLKSIGKPVVGDPKYGDPSVNRSFRTKFGLERQFLHNHKTVVKGYKNGEDLVLECPLPPEMEKIVTDLFGR